MEAINLDILPGAMPPIVHVSQGDVGRQFSISVYDDTGAAYSLTGKTLSIVGHKGDGNIFQYELPSSAISGNTVTITTEEQMTPAAGKALCEIRIEDGGTKLGTCNFIMDVEQGPADIGSLSISALYTIDALFERAQTDIDTATTAASTATQKASEASISATTAATSAEAASTSATTAATSASTASSYASTAATEAGNASSYANAAALSATAAETYATNATNSATAASTSATNAAASEAKIANMTVSSQSVAYTQPATVTKTEVGGVYNLDFKIPRGEPTSGHDVEANPSGDASGDLTKLGIDGTIYNVSGGSGAQFVKINRDISWYLFINKVYSDSSYSTKIYDRSSEASFTFENGQKYYIETMMVTIPGTQKFYNPDVSGIHYAARCSVQGKNFGQIINNDPTSLPELNADFGNFYSIIAYPEDFSSQPSSLDIANGSPFENKVTIDFGYDPISYEPITAHYPIKPADVAVNTLDDKITFVVRIGFEVTGGSNIVWNPAFWPADFALHAIYDNEKDYNYSWSAYLEE